MYEELMEKIEKKVFLNEVEAEEKIEKNYKKGLLNYEELQNLKNAIEWEYIDKYIEEAYQRENF